MSPLLDLAAILFGTSGVVLGVVMLLSEHRSSPIAQRYTIGAMALLCFLVAVDGSVSLRSYVFDFSPSPIAVGFAAMLSTNWAFRLRTSFRRPPKMRSL